MTSWVVAFSTPDRNSAAHPTETAQLLPKYHPTNNASKMFCISKIEIQRCMKELQTCISRTAPQELITQGGTYLFAKATLLLHDLDFLFLLR
jgi:hypothetical protein